MSAGSGMLNKLRTGQSESCLLCCHFGVGDAVTSSPGPALLCIREAEGVVQVSAAVSRPQLVQQK